MNPTQIPAGGRISTSQNNIPQAVTVCQRVTNSQGTRYGVSNNKPSNSLGMTDGGEQMTNTRLAVGKQQYMTRASNPGGDDPSSTSSDTEIDDFPNRNQRQPDGNGGGDRRGSGLGMVQRRREERQNAIQNNIKKTIRDHNKRL